MQQPRNSNSFKKIAMAVYLFKLSRKLIALDPRIPVIYFCRGFAYSELKQYTKAIQDFTKAIDLDPLYKKAYVNRGMSYHDIKQVTKAIQDFTQNIDLNPKISNSYSMRGLCYLNTERFRQACLDAKTACELGNCSILEHLKKHYKDIYNCE